MVQRTILLAAVAMLAAPGAARADPVTLQPLAEARLRFEQVDQDGLRRADGLTARVRGGLEASTGRWSALAEAQGVLAIVDHYYDGLRGDATRAGINDPENVALYRLQLRYAAPGAAMTAGRQKIALDDERFIGVSNWRDSSQSEDAVRAELTPLPGLKLDLSYAWSARTIWGISGYGARQQAVSGDNVFANAAYKTPIGLVTAFAYLIDQDEAAMQGYRLSSQNYGLRLAGDRKLGAVKLSWQASVARQSDYHRNPNRYHARYLLLDGAAEAGPVKLGGGYEVLGASDGVALTSFQTPLASNFKFQGWADKFTSTPPDGVRDLYGSGSYTVPTATALGPVTVQAVYHRFDSDRLVRRYGDEWDFLASAKLGRTAISVRYADYRASGFGADTRKLWLELDWGL